MRVAACSTAPTSSMMRTSSSAGRKRPLRRIANTSGSASVAGARSVTYVPEPWRGSSTPIETRARMASRSVGRETPSCAASSRSTGSRSPGSSTPRRISSLICSAASAATERRATGTNASSTAPVYPALAD